jgi:hypothetical protein
MTESTNQNIVQVNNSFSVPESFDTNILHQLSDYKITVMNSQLENKNSKRSFKRFQICYDEFN